MGLIEFITVGSYSIGVAALVAVVRFRKIHRSFHPFVFILFMGLVAEVISYLLIHVVETGNAVATNIFGLAEGLLWLWQFKCWNGFERKPRTFPVLVSVLALAWLVENIALGKIMSFSSAYAIGCSFMIVFLSINQVNRLIVEENRNLFTNSVFLICSGTIIFYTYRIFVESFYVFEMQQSNAFLSNVFIILAFVNLFVNLLFALATLWIPTRQRFSLPFS